MKAPSLLTALALLCGACGAAMVPQAASRPEVEAPYPDPEPHRIRETLAAWDQLRNLKEGLGDLQGALTIQQRCVQVLGTLPAERQAKLKAGMPAEREAELLAKFRG